MQQMRALADEQEAIIQEGYDERERLRRVHAASEVDLEMALRSNTALQSQLQVPCLSASILPPVKMHPDTCRTGWGFW